MTVISISSNKSSISTLQQVTAASHTKFNSLKIGGVQHTMILQLAEKLNS